MHALLKLITGTLCSRILGFFRDVVFFAILGSSLEASAFLIAFSIPNLFRRLCGEGALSSAFVPVFAQRYIQQPQSAAKFLNLFFTRFGVYLATSIFVAMVFLACCHPYMSSVKWSTVLYLTNAMLPYLWFICMAALLNGALNVLNAFSLTGFSPVLLNLSMLFGLALCPCFKTSIESTSFLAICVVFGGFLQWILPKIQLKRKGFPLNAFSWEADPDLNRIWLLFLPSVLGTAIFQINVMLGRFLAYGIDEHGVSFLYVANRFLELPLGLFAFAIISVLLPKLSLAYAQNNTYQAKYVLKQGIQLLLLLLVPAAIGLHILAAPILNLCFCWGNFSQNDTLQVVPLLKTFAYGLPVFGLTALLARVFYANNDTITPVKLSGITLGVYILTTCLLIPSLGICSLPLASVLSSFIQLCLQIRAIQKRYPYYSLQWRDFFYKKVILFLLFVGMVALCNCCYPWNQQKIHDAFGLCVVVGLSCLGYLFLLKHLHSAAFRQLIHLTIEPDHLR